MRYTQPVFLSAFLGGVRAVAVAPLVILAAYAATLLVAVPMTAALAAALAGLLQSTPLADPAARLTPLAAWESIGRSGGLAATFTPAILGIAAPLDNISGILSRRMPASSIAAAILAYAGVWLLLWGGVIAALAHGWTGWRAFVVNGARSFAPIAQLTAIAFASYAVVFLVVHPLPVPRQLVPPASEAMALARLMTCVLLLVAISVFVDFTRIRIVLSGRTAAQSASDTLQLIRGHLVSVIGLSLLAAIPMAAAFAGYAAFELLVRGVPSMWSAIAAGHLYIVARLAARLTTAGAQSALWQRLEATLHLS